MKHNIRLYIIVFIISLYTVLALLGEHNYKQIEKDLSEVVYLLSLESGILEPVSYELEEDFSISKIIEKLKAGDGEESLGVVPEGLRIIYTRLDNKKAIVNFNITYYTIEPVEEFLLRASLIKSLTSYDQVSSVEIFVEGVPRRVSKGSYLGAYSDDDVYMSFEDMFLKDKKTPVTIYYPQGQKLVKKIVEIPIDSNKKTEESLIQYMISDLENPIFPAGSQLIDVYTHEDVCYVDFNETFESELLPAGLNPELVIYSIVNSLVDLPDVTRVQFFVNGHVIGSFHGTVNLDRLLTKKYDLLN